MMHQYILDHPDYILGQRTHHHILSAYDDASSTPIPPVYDDASSTPIPPVYDDGFAGPIYNQDDPGYTSVYPGSS
jgi:hypothetical protein